MSIELQQPSLAPQITSLLAALRLRIRGYVWTQGAARLGVVLGLAFWITLAFDWLFEPPWQFRAVMLACVAAALVYVLYRHILRRAFHPLDDASMALVLERRFPNYRDSLLTTVEMDQQPSHAGTFNREMLDFTRRQALAHSEHVRLKEVFRLAPLMQTLCLAAALLVSVLAFAALAQGAMHTWYERVVLLNKDLLWPRSNHVRVQAFPADHRRKVAKGSDFEVVAAADLQEPFKMPRSVEVRYRTDEGVHGRDNMSSVGSPSERDPQQKYSYMFKGIMSSIDFDVLGGDDRDRGYRLEVVDNPAISKMQLTCEYPGYTGRGTGTVPASAVVQLPQGTNITINCEANKPLVSVPVTIVQGEKSGTLTELKPSQIDPRQFSLVLPALMEDTTLLFELHDADGIQSRDPVRLTLIAAPDEAPVLTMRLRGISTAVTPQAKLPAAGDARDDYGLTRLWFEYLLTAPPEKNSPKGETPSAKAAPAEQSFRAATAGHDGRPKTQVTIELADNELLDLKQLRDAGKLQPKVGDRLFVTLKATDNCALPSGMNVGQGEKYQLDIVPPEQLLSMLEGRELMLRRRFEVIYQEMLDTRDALARVDFKSPDATNSAAGDKSSHEPGDEPGEKAPGAESPSAKETPEQRLARLAKHASELRDLRVNRALDNSDRSASETLTVADSFDDIREEMTNNRVDTPEVQTRLKDQIADPLRRISVEMFPQLKGLLQQLRGVLDDPKAGKARLQQSLTQADAILVQMKLVLDKMLELESYNEVVEQLRQIIVNQRKLNEETLKHQKEELKQKLRDLEN